MNLLCDGAMPGRAPGKPTVAAMADASSKSSSFGNNLGALRSAGLITYAIPGCVGLTVMGFEVANLPDKPTTQADVHAAWLAMVTRPQAAILEVLIGTWPEPMPKALLADSVGASSISSSFGNNLGALRSLGAIDYPQAGFVKATDLLFPRGRA